MKAVAGGTDWASRSGDDILVIVGRSLLLLSAGGGRCETTRPAHVRRVLVQFYPAKNLKLAILY
jgi:hypothetical protein